MSLEQTIVELTLAINRLATNMQANTETGHRIISTLSNSESNFTQSELPLVTDNDDCVTRARESADDTPAPAPAKRTRASRTHPVLSAAMPPPPEDDVPATPTEAPQEQPSITLSDIREHALGYRDRNGLDAARALLATFNVERIGDLDYNQYGNFIKACAP